MYPDSGYVMYPNADIGSPRTGFLVSGKKAINAITTVYIKKGGWAHLNDYEKMKPLEELGTKTAVSGTTVLEAIKNNCFNPETLKILNLAEVRSGLLKVLRMAIQKPPK